jgi:hypothetical protein
MIDGSGQLLLIYRNVSSLAYKNLQLRLEVGDKLGVEVRPKKIVTCAPAERCVFALRAISNKSTPATKFWVDALLSSEGYPRLKNTRLQVDAGPDAGKKDTGWMDAGTIQVVNRSQNSRVIGLTLLSLVPLIFLLGLGWVLKKRVQKPRRP